MQYVSKLLSLAMVVGFLSLTSVGYTATPPTQDLVQPVGIIELFKPENLEFPFNRGTGVFVSPTQILTATHVVADSTKEGVVTKFRMENGDTYNVTNIQNSKDIDLGILTVDKPYKGYVPAYNCVSQTRGTELITIGNPLVMEFIESKVLVTGGRPSVRIPEAIVDPQKKTTEPNTRTTPDDSRKRFTVVPPDKVGPPKSKEEVINMNGAKFYQGIALPGQSGSPIYDKDGNIVGIVAITIVDGGSGTYSGIGMYLETSAACDFLKETIKP